MADKVKFSLSLNGSLTGQSDSVGINFTDFELDVENPSLTSASRNTVSGTPFEILGTSAAPAAGGSTQYVYVRNVGANGDLSTGGKVILTNGAGTNIAHLNVGDAMFIPLIAQAGLKAKYDNSVTTYVYAYLKRH
jgi:hypothetical protein|tara:strand:+ start:185 stop:589 length:405 start_codon:yes stop_codon:yes gene_type:complete